MPAPKRDTRPRGSTGSSTDWSLYALPADRPSTEPTGLLLVLRNGRQARAWSISPQRPRSSRAPRSLYPRPRSTSIFGAITDQLKKDGLSDPHACDYVAGRFDAAETMKQLRRAPRDAVFFPGHWQEALSLMREADKANWFPSVFCSAEAWVARFCCAGFNGKVFCAFPSAPDVQAPTVSKSCARWQNQMRAAVATSRSSNVSLQRRQILVEALKRAGKDLSREKLIQALEDCTMPDRVHSRGDLRTESSYRCDGRIRGHDRFEEEGVRPGERLDQHQQRSRALGERDPRNRKQSC